MKVELDLMIWSCLDNDTVSRTVGGVRVRSTHKTNFGSGRSSIVYVEITHSEICPFSLVT